MDARDMHVYVKPLLIKIVGTRPALTIDNFDRKTT